MRFLNEDEERQYLAQSPPTNTLLPRDQGIKESSGEDTPRQPNLVKQWNTTQVSGQEGDDDEWVDESEEESGADPHITREEWNVEGMAKGVQDVSLQK